MNPSVDNSIKEMLTNRLLEIEQHFNADVLSYYGPILDGNENIVLNIVEELRKENKSNRLFIMLTTTGGSAVAVERYVNIVRKHYHEVNFIVPDYAYSAGTIFCMSGDNIYMDYFSVLGPIDPQVQNKDGKWVAALGYLDKVNEMVERAKANDLTNVEFLILRDIDLAELREFEQAKELTIALLKKWLVKYKFKNWDFHLTNPTKAGQKVTQKEKEQRAKEIADKLSNNNLWRSHGRPINIETLEKDIRLKIEDYNDHQQTRTLIRYYYDLFNDFITKNSIPIFVHTRKFN